MTIIQGVDYSTTPPGGAALRAAGYEFACRYLGTDSRCLTIPERDDLNAHGVKIVLIKETDGLGFRSGAVTAKIDATNAQDDIARVQLPLDSPAYFTVDDQFNVADQPGLAAYLNECAVVLGARKRVGLYGPLAAIEFAAANGLAHYYWQTSGWSGIPTVWFPGNNLEQYAYAGPEHPELTINGTACDATRALTADYGQIGGASVQPAPAPAPKPAPKPTVHYPNGLDAAIAARLFGSFKASNGVTVAYAEGDELSALWLAGGSYGRLTDVGVYTDSPTVTRLYWAFSDGRVYWRPNANTPITLLKAA